jgi:DNA-binding transcriptional LysR family regulator
VDLSLRHLRALLTVAEEASMTRAATRLNLTQQAVSAQIQQLERAVGAKLLTRAHRGVMLTPAGEVVVRQGAAMLAAEESLLEAVARVVRGRPGRLRIAFKAQSTAHFMPRVAEAMHRRLPDVDLEVRSVAILNEEVDLLTSGAADAAFVWLPVGDDRLTATEVLVEQRVVALAPDHRLAGRGQVTLDDLGGEPVIGPHSALPWEVVRFWAVDPRPDGRAAVYGPEARTPEECLQLVRRTLFPVSAAVLAARCRRGAVPARPRLAPHARAPDAGHLSFRGPVAG